MKEKSIVKIIVAIITIAGVTITAIATIISSLLSKGSTINIINYPPGNQSTHEPSDSPSDGTSSSIKNDDSSSNGDSQSVINDSSSPASTSSDISEPTKNEKSDWVLRSKVPYGAEIVERKWEYTKTETKESENANESGWTPTGSYWKITGSGTHSYATFPFNSNGYEYYNNSDQYYKKYNVSAYTKSETANAKREITNEQVTSYIYYHWVYPLSGSHSETDREIGEFKNKWINDGGYANIWESFENGYIEYNSWAQAYEARGHSAYSFWWNGRIPVYTQDYTDYTKIYQYKRESRKTSTSEVKVGDNISNVQELVRYLQ